MYALKDKDEIPDKLRKRNFMIKNYFKIALRSVVSNKWYSALNIGGLAVGLSAVFLLILYINFESSYDLFHKKVDRLYRVVTDITTPSGEHKNAVVDWNILGELSEEFPEIEDYTRIHKTELNIQVNSENFHENEVIAADAAFFALFDFDLLKGNPATALRDPMSVVLTKSSAKKYFADENAVGKTISIMDGKYNAKVTGIIKDFPENTQIRGDIILSISSYTEVINPELKQSWAEFSNYGYVLLNKGAMPEVLEEKIENYNQRAHGNQMRETKLKLLYRLEPLSKVYLYSEQGNGTARVKGLYSFGLIALIILLIAAINFINLTTARSTLRAKEVGIRKVIGAQKNQLTLQFLTESIIICLLAFLFAVILTELILPYFNILVGKEIATSIFQESYLFIFLGITIVIAFIAGFYPAIVLASFSPHKVLKGTFSGKLRGVFLRKGLVIFQFSISLLLIIGTIVIYKQTTYMRTSDLGFDKEQLLVLETGGSSGQKLLKSALIKNPNVLSVTTVSGVPGGGGNMEAVLSTVENREGNTQTLALKRYHVDEEFIPQLNLKLIAGRNFSAQLASDSTEALILNEKATQLLGFADPQNIIGKRFDQGDKKGRVIGVVKDFHFSSLKKEIRGLSLVMDHSQDQLLALKMDTKNIDQTLEDIKSHWKQYLPNQTFDYYFLDDFFDRQYSSELHFGKIFLMFTVLAIFIGILGLFGLSAFTILQRRREIGIRKISGATVVDILNMITKDFTKLILLSIVLASPIAWYFLNDWLQDFAYHITIDAWIFIEAGTIILFIALATVSFHAIKAANTNPVKSLKTE